MKFKSLNESILSVTNPQPELDSSLLKEGLLGKLKKKVTRFNQAFGRTLPDERSKQGLLAFSPSSMLRSLRYHRSRREEIAAERKARATVKEGQAYSGDPPYSGVERRAKSGSNQRATKGSSRTEYNHSIGEYRPAGEEDRYYARQRAEAKAKKTTTVKEEQEYTELLETIIIAIANELNISPQTLIEEFSEQELSEELRKKIMHGLKVATAAGALLAGGAAGALGYGHLGNHFNNKANNAPISQKAHSPSSQKDHYSSKQKNGVPTSTAAAAKAKAKKARDDDDIHLSTAQPWMY